MQLWLPWWNALWLLRPGFSRLRTFLWFATAVAGFTVRTDLLGVSSIVRALKLDERFYTPLLDHFHTQAVKLERLTVLWAQVVLRLFPGVLRVNGRLVLVGDGIKTPKRGRKMPSVKLLHQQSASKPEYIMGHSLQVVSVLVQAASSVFAVPLTMRIHEGLVWSNRDRRTLLDKMIALLQGLAITQPYYFVADAYYAAGKMVCAMLDRGNHLLTRAKSNSIAYAAPAAPGARRRGRPKLYGKKIKLNSLFKDTTAFQSAASPVYGEKTVTIRYRVCDLLWRPAKRAVRFVLVVHPSRGSLILMCTDTSLAAIEIIRLYGLRFKIGVSSRRTRFLVGESPTEVKRLRPRSLGGTVERKRDGGALRQHTLKGGCAKHPVVITSERRSSLVKRSFPVAETVYCARRQQEPSSEESSAAVLTGGVSAATGCERRRGNWRSPRYPAGKARRGGSYHNRTRERWVQVSGWRIGSQY